MNMTPPSPLYRYVKGDGALYNHLNGNLWFRSHAYFRGIENGDELEGVGSYNIPGCGSSRDVSDDRPMQPAYFMSFSEDPDATKDYGDGDYFLELPDPVRFKEEITRELPHESGFVKVEWHKIKYGKTMEVEEHLGARETIDRKLYHKPEKYSAEKEWRLEIKFLHSFRVENKTLKFLWPKIGERFELKMAKASTTLRG